MECKASDEMVLNSKLSFAPLIEAWKRSAAEGSTGKKKLYQNLLERVLKHPELLLPIDSPELLTEHAEWVDILISTIFPISYSEDKDLYAVAIPFSYKIIFASALFRKQFMDEKGEILSMPDIPYQQPLSEDKCSVAYKLILSKFYGQEIQGNVTAIHHYRNPVNGMINYIELELDTTFIDVKALAPLPEIGTSLHCCNIAELGKMDQLKDMLPLGNFQFEGLTIVRLRDVTQREVINNIKSILLEARSYEDDEIFSELQEQVRALMGMPELDMGITPFFRINDNYFLSEQFGGHSMMVTNSEQGISIRESLCKEFLEMFRESETPVLFSEINAKQILNHPFLSRLPHQGYYSAAFYPLKSKGKLLGVLSVVHPQEGKIQRQHLAQLNPAVPLFVLAIEKGAEILSNEVDKIIKKHFTAVQSSVEWKFTEAAVHYLTNKKNGIKAKIEPIFFDHVFPLYGAVDIRNSSIERVKAIQLDLIEQLKLAGEIVRKAQEISPLPILQEVSYRIDKYLYNVSNILFSGDELIIDKFLKNEVIELFEHLKVVLPTVSNDIDTYLSRLDPRIRLLVDNRHKYEESITLINQEIARFLDQEQEHAQKIYPHYFERFVTDGVDFNMYIGQSISPERPFDTFYLKNLKMWQLTTLTRAAKIVNELQQRLSKPLQTTQLILAHSLPISISFRTAERKFDVEGAYNMRYEIIKKRIDKVHLKDSNERLTQTGKLAIVFSQPREAAEYLDYIEFLQNQGLLLKDLEQLELEELQGVIGLKALRVGINMEGPARNESVSTLEVKELQ
ncbi:GAF domain-containing protein [Flavihumibacter sediminis]|nr:GAF domain-containing protein [Flavihumibacter sediminis]